MMRKLRILWLILRTTSTHKIVIGFVLFILLVAAIIQVAEPNIDAYGDAVWYCFTVVTTIGFGDFYAVTFIGRIATVVLAVYGIFVVALIPGIVVSYYMEVIKVRTDEVQAEFMEKLEHLDQLPHEELVALATKIRKHKLNED